MNSLNLNLSDINELHVENDGGVWRNIPGRKTIHSVSHFRRNFELDSFSLRHPLHTFVKERRLPLPIPDHIIVVVAGKLVDFRAILQGHLRVAGNFLTLSRESDTIAILHDFDLYARQIFNS